MIKILKDNGFLPKDVDNKDIDSMKIWNAIQSYKAQQLTKPHTKQADLGDK